MPQNNRPRSWREMRDRASQNPFVGREYQLQVFRSMLSTPYDSRDRVIFNISGQGGIGKTTLLKQFRKIAEELRQVVAYVDEGAQSNSVDTVPEAIDRLVIDCEKQGQMFNGFRERYKVYRQRRQELETDPEAPQGFAAGMGRVLTKAGLGAARSIPGSGAVLDLVDVDAVADKTGEWMSFIARKLTNKDEVRLMQEPLKVLTPLFLEDLNRIAEKQTVVLLLDTYEQTGAFLDDWLRSVLDERYGEITPNFLIGIAGREPLSRNAWIGLEGWIVRSELEPFTPDEARQYLVSKGITNESVIQEIWRLSSGGLPLLISMMAQAAPPSVDEVIDHCEQAVERFLKWERDEPKRMIAQSAALPRLLNRDVLAVLTSDETADTLFDWLKSLPFVVEHPDGWQYHSIVRQLIGRYCYKVSPKQWKTLHGKLAAYYDELRQGLKLEDSQQWKDKTWQKYSLEWLYHSLCTAPQRLDMALNGWLSALQFGHELEKDWANTIMTAGEFTNCAEVQQWGEQLRQSLQAYDEENYKPILDVLSLLLKDSRLDNKHRAIAIVQQIMIVLIRFFNQQAANLKAPPKTPNRNACSPDYSQILLDLNNAVNLAPDEPGVFMMRGHIHMLVGNIEASEIDFKQAIELDEDQEEEVSSMRTTYYSQLENMKSSIGRLIDNHSKLAEVIRNNLQENTRLLDLPKEQQPGLLDLMKGQRIINQESKLAIEELTAMYQKITTRLQELEVNINSQREISTRVE